MWTLEKVLRHHITNILDRSSKLKRFGNLRKRRSLKCWHGQVLGVTCQGMDLPISHTGSSDGLDLSGHWIQLWTQHCCVTLATGRGFFLQSHLTILVQQRMEIIKGSSALWKFFCGQQLEFIIFSYTMESWLGPRLQGANTQNSKSLSRCC